MNMKRNKKPLSSLLSLLPSPSCVFSLSWLSKLKQKISISRFKKNQESFQALNWEKPKSLKMDLNWHKQKDYKKNAIKDTKEVKMNKVAKEETKGKCSKGLDRFAVVRSSMDPQKDFKDSMVEMIREKGIRRAGELEELLACYLMLNHDEYHDLIVQVFREIWFEILEDRASRITI